MKKFLTLIGVAALLATVIKSNAQEGGFPLQSQVIALPTVIVAANNPTNFANPPVIDFGKTKAITPSFTLSTSLNQTNITFLGAWSNDGVNYDTNNSVTLTALAKVGVATTTATNTLTSNSRRYFEIWSEIGVAGGIITNNSASYGATVSPY